MYTAAALHIIAGVCLFAAVHHLLEAMRRQFEPTILMFAAMCAAGSVAIESLALSYQAATVTRYVALLKWNLGGYMVGYTILVWFIARLTAVSSRLWVLGCSAMFVVLFVWNALQPFGLSYIEITRLAALHLPWGEAISQPVGRVAPAHWILFLSMLAVLLVAIWSLVKAWRRSRERPLLFMVLAIVLLLAAAIEGLLVRANLIEFVHAGPFGFLALIVAMSLSLSHMTQRALLVSERRFRSLVEQSPFSIQVLSADGRTLQVNGAWRRLWGPLAGERLSIAAEIAPHVELAKQGTAIDVPPRPYEIGGASQAMQERWIRTFIYPIKDDSGNVRNVILMHEDVTERQRADEAMRAVSEELRQTQRTVLQQERLRALGQMASGVAHDINNAISPAAVYVETLLEHDKTLSSRAREYLAVIQQGIEAVAQSVSRLREFYRPREQDARLEQVDIHLILRQVIELTRARWSDMPQQRGIVIHLREQLAANLPAVMGSEAEVRDSFTNLIFNAVDAMPSGGTLTIRSEVLRDASCVEFVDTGLGMNEETRRRCMEPFFTTKGERGTGLGLATVYGMVQRHGGAVEIESQPGKGTLVRLLFPRNVVARTGAGQTAAARELATGLRILVIDDDALQLEALRMSLEAAGNRVTCAGGGQAGIDAFLAAAGSDDAFAAVITDLGMPHIDGRKVALAVTRASSHTPVVLLTGWGQSMIAQNDVPEGVACVVSKPANVAELLGLLAQLIAEQKRAAAG